MLLKSSDTPAVATRIIQTRYSNDASQRTSSLALLTHSIHSLEAWTHLDLTAQSCAYKQFVSCRSLINHDAQVKTCGGKAESLSVAMTSHFTMRRA